MQRTPRDQQGAYSRRPFATEATALLFPARRKWSLQLLQDQALIRAAREDRLDDIGRQQGQSEDPANVAFRDVLGIADIADRRVDSFEHPLPPPRARERLDQCSVQLRLRGRHDFAAVRGDHALAAASAMETSLDEDRACSTRNS
jgi:hypothetical protein